MNKVMLDTSALLAWFQDEQGVTMMDEILESSECYMSSVNLAEFAAKCAEKIISKQEIIALIEDLSIQVIAFDQQQALHSGRLMLTTKKFGLSLGDRACLVAANTIEARVITADKIWSKLAAEFPIQCIR